MAEASATPNDLYLRRLRENLSCPVCYELFTAQTRLPKALPCIHTMCAQCLSSYVDERPEGGSLRCPLCQAPFVLPGPGVRGLPTNTMLVSMLDLLERPRVNAGDKSKKDLDDEECATMSPRCVQHDCNCALFCLDCEQPLCLKCLIDSDGKHSSHSLEELKAVRQSFNKSFEQAKQAYQDYVAEGDGFIAETIKLVEQRKAALREELEKTLDQQIQALKLQCKHVFKGNVSALLRDFDTFIAKFHQQKMDIANAIFQLNPTTYSKQNNELLSEINSKLRLMHGTLEAAKEAKVTMSTLNKFKPRVKLESGSASKLVESTSDGTQTEYSGYSPEEQESLEHTARPAKNGRSDLVLHEELGVVAPTTVNMYLDLNEISHFLKRASDSSVYSQQWIVKGAPWKLEADFNRDKLRGKNKGEAVLWVGAVCDKRGTWRHNASYVLKLYDFNRGEFVLHDADARHVFSNVANDWGCEVLTKEEITDPGNPYVSDGRLRVLMTLTVHS